MPEGLKPEGLAPVRRSIRPQTGDTFASVAARELADTPTDDAVASLREWNTHLTRFARGPRPLLVSDIIYGANPQYSPAFQDTPTPDSLYGSEIATGTPQPS